MQVVYFDGILNYGARVRKQKTLGVTFSHIC